MITSRPPRVRRRFIVALIVTLPLLAHAIWDYVEARRLRTRVDAIERRGEPLGSAHLVQLSPAAADADRLYRAASALAPGFDLGASSPKSYELLKAIHDGIWTPEVRHELRVLLARHPEAFALADRAAALPFAGFAPGTTHNYQTSHMMALARICALRGTLRALDGDGDGAFDALYSALRIERTLERPFPLPGLKLLLDQAHPSAAARARVARALDEIDVDDLLKQVLLKLRAQWLNGSAFQRRIGELPWLVRPWEEHRMTRVLDVFGMLIAAADMREADRVAAVLAVGQFPAAMDISPEQSHVSLERFTRGIVQQADWIRCARRAVAGEVVDCQL